MKSLIIILFLSSVLYSMSDSTCVDSTDIKRLDKKLQNIDFQFKITHQKIRELEDLKQQLIGAYNAISEEKKIAEDKSKIKNKK